MLSQSSVFFYVCLTVCSGGVANELFNCSEGDTKYPLFFIGYFPCEPTPGSAPEECDYFLHSAVDVAETLLQEDGYYSNSCFTVQISRYSNLTDETAVVKSLHQELGPSFQHYLHGVIGPSLYDTAKLIGYTLGRQFNVLQVSYIPVDDILSDRARYPTFYATASTTNFLNIAMLERTAAFTQQAISLGFDVHLKGSFVAEESQKVIVRQLSDSNLLVNVALIEEKDARNLFCAAIQYNMTTSRYVWILPGFYNPNWWYTDENSTDSSCTNEQILEAATGTIFIDTLNIQYSPSTIHIADYLINDTLRALNDSQHQGEWFASFLHTRALNAIDAIQVLTYSWLRAIEHLTSNGILTPDELIQLLYQPLNYQDRDDTLVNTVAGILKNELTCYNGLAGHHHLAINESDGHYGQALVTQFNGSVQCIAGIIDRSDDNATIFSQDVNGYRPYFHVCNIIWKDGVQPHDGLCNGEKCVCYSGLPDWAIVLNALIVLAVMSMGILFLVSNFYYRQNKHFKASSPWLNALITVACILIYPTTLLDAIDSAGIQTFSYGEWTNHSCQFNQWLYYMCASVIFCTILVKNFRIFQIFHNAKLKERKFLSDPILIIATGVLMAPCIITLIIWTIVDPMKLEVITESYLCPEYKDDPGIVNTYLVSTICSSFYLNYWLYALFGYFCIIMAAILYFACHNTAIISHFKREGEISALAVSYCTIIIFITAAFASIISYAVGKTGHFSLYYYALYTSSTLSAITSILLFLYIPKYWSIYKDSMKNRKADRERKKSSELNLYYSSQQEKIHCLQEIVKLKEEKIDSYSVNTNFSE